MNSSLRPENDPTRGWADWWSAVVAGMLRALADELQDATVPVPDAASRRARSD